MRMWMVNPKLLCRNHLLGEHRELHTLIGTLGKGTSIKGYLNNNLIEIHNIKKRHEELVLEMLNRGYNHHSPLETENIKLDEMGYVDRQKNINELIKRCEQCKKNIIGGRNE